MHVPCVPRYLLLSPWEPSSCCSFPLLSSRLEVDVYIGVGVTASPGISGSHSHTCVKKAKDCSLVLAQLQTRHCQAHLRRPAYMHAQEWGYDQAPCNVPQRCGVLLQTVSGPGPTVDKYIMHSHFACKNLLPIVKEFFVKYKTLRTLADKSTCSGCKSAQNSKNDTSYCVMVTASALPRALTHPER